MVSKSRRPRNDQASHIIDGQARIGAIAKAHSSSFDRLKFQVPNQIELVTREPSPLKPSSMQ